ncbi:MAG: T9SS type A sorting domain-containing protein [Ignavibacteria bacterium]
MKKLILTTAIAIILNFISAVSYSQSFTDVVALQRVYFTGNNIFNYFQNTGIFNQNTTNGNTAGLFWAADSMKSYCFTAGFNMSAIINGKLAQLAGSYKGEYAPGYFIDSLYNTNTDMKLYKVNRTDNSWNNPDYANWYKMIPFGAPFEDINNNCIYDDGIDKPGVPEASQTLFIVYADGDLSQRSPGEGFGGGIKNPIFGTEVRLTVWAYEIYLPDVQYMRYQIVNKSKNTWDSTYFGIFADPDSPLPDFASYRDIPGCDTLLNLGYSWNNDSTFVCGAYGVQLLQGPYNKVTGDTIGMTAFTFSRMQYLCQGEANGEPRSAYNYMKGYKTDGTSFLDPTYTPYKKTKFAFSGDPETNAGWTPAKGFIFNCGGVDTGAIILLPGYDDKFLLGTGADNLRIMPGDTQNVYFSQLLAKGITNKNSVTKLKSLAYSNIVFFKSGMAQDVEKNCGSVKPIPDDFGISQNFPNPFNGSTIIRYSIPRSSYVKITIYDMLGKEIAVPVNGQISAGYYETSISAKNLSSGIYFYRMEVTDNTVSNSLKLGRVYKMAVIK